MIIQHSLDGIAEAYKRRITVSKRRDGVRARDVMLVAWPVCLQIDERKVAVQCPEDLGLSREVLEKQADASKRRHKALPGWTSTAGALQARADPTSARHCT